MTDESTDGVSVGPPIRTRRWWVVELAVLGLILLGLLTFEPGLFALAAVGIAFTTYATAAVGGDGSGLEIERTVDDRDPVPGQTVTVTVTLKNTGSEPIYDIRFVDGVPGALEVAEGSPRVATAVRPGEEYTHSYDIKISRGEHAFEPATAAVRSLGGVVERKVTITHKTTVTCSPALSELPLRAQTSIFTGRLPTDVGGSGLEFHSTREFRPEDPLKRINWRRYAKQGELATVNFREQRAATVMLLIDDRPAAYWAASPADRHAVEYAITGTGQVFGTLVGNGDQVGITTLGDEDAWLAPSAGQAALAEARHFLATHPTLRYEPPEEIPELAITPEHTPVDLDRIRARLPDDSQVIVFTPLCDDGIVPVLKRLEASGHATTVISPDVTRRDTTGRRLAWTQRINRLATLRDAGIRVIEWDLSKSLPEVLVTEKRRGEYA